MVMNDNDTTRAVTQSLQAFDLEIAQGDWSVLSRWIAKTAGAWQVARRRLQEDGSARAWRALMEAVMTGVQAQASQQLQVAQAYLQAVQQVDGEDYIKDQAKRLEVMEEQSSLISEAQRWLSTLRIAASQVPLLQVATEGEVRDHQTANQDFEVVHGQGQG